MVMKTTLSNILSCYINLCDATQTHGL